MTNMLDAFIKHERMLQPMPMEHRTIGYAPGTRLLRIVRDGDSWIMWTATRDYIHGVWYELRNDGSAYRWTCDETGDECIRIRHTDDHIRRKL